jgi:hypothetical protein
MRDYLTIAYYAVLDGIVIEGLRKGFICTTPEDAVVWISLSNSGSLYPYKIERQNVYNNTKVLFKIVPWTNGKPNE